MSGQARRIGENAIMQQLNVTSARLASMHICVTALLEYFGPIPDDLDAQMQALLSNPDSRKKPFNALLADVVVLVSKYKASKAVTL